MPLLAWLSENPRFALVILALLYIIFAVPLIQTAEERWKAEHSRRRAQRAAQSMRWGN
jgi:MFS-type transporter involved in bile tolerance (Atg22 family)